MANTEFFSTPLFSDANCKNYYRAEGTTDSKGTVNLTNNGGVAYNPAVFNNGFDFGTANTTKWMSSTNNLGIDGGAITVSMWTKINTVPAASTYYMLSCQANNTSKVLYNFYYGNNGTNKVLSIYRLKFGVAQQGTAYTQDLGTADFYHLAFTYDGTSIYSYVNAVQTGPVSASGNGISPLTEGLYIGAYNDASLKSNAIIDDIVIFNRALTAAEIANIFNGNTVFRRKLLGVGL